MWPKQDKYISARTGESLFPHFIDFFENLKQPLLNIHIRNVMSKFQSSRLNGVATERNAWNSVVPHFIDFSKFFYRLLNIVQIRSTHSRHTRKPPQGWYQSDLHNATAPLAFPGNREKAKLTKSAIIAIRGTRNEKWSDFNFSSAPRRADSEGKTRPRSL